MADSPITETLSVSDSREEENHRAISKKNDVVLSVRHVSKKFCKTLKRSMYYGMIDLTRNLFGIRADFGTLRTGEFWAVDDMSFDLKKGQVLGVIGPNGSGKTTLMRLMAGIFPPDRGEIITKGKVASLISLGIGFHPHMSGRENIYLNAAILGMRRNRIDEQIREIIEFSELGDFIRAPISTYSSGMRVRLGFSIAISTQPDILLLDEVLAVGDRGFKAKCFRKINELSESTAIVLVSHSMARIYRLCTEIMVMDHGKKVFYTKEVSEGVEYYFSMFDTEESHTSHTDKNMLHDVNFLSPNSSQPENDLFAVEHLDDLTIETTLSLDESVQTALMKIIFYDKDFKEIARSKSDLNRFEIQNMAQKMKLQTTFPELQLNPGKYSITIIINDTVTEKALVKAHGIKQFQVTGNFRAMSAFHLKAHWRYG